MGHLVGGHSKKLLLQDKKKNLYLLSALPDTKVDLRQLSTRLEHPYAQCLCGGSWLAARDSRSPLIRGWSS